MGDNFFYGNKKVNNAYALQIPLESLEDEEINEKFQAFKNTRTVGRVFTFIPLVYAAILVGYNQPAGSGPDDVTGFVAVLLSSTVANVICIVVSNNQLRKAVDRYNLLIIDKNKLGFHLEPLPNNQQLVGFRFSRSLGSRTR